MRRLVGFSIVLSILGFVAFAHSYTYQIKTTVVNVNATATKLPTTPLVGREYVQVQNVGSVTLYIGASTVFANATVGGTGGTQLTPYSIWYGEYDHTVDIYGRIATGNCTVIVEEGK